MVNITRIVFSVIIFIGVIFIGCGWFIDAYSGYRWEDEDGTWNKAKFCKNEVCSLDSEDTIIFDTCVSYCDDIWKLMGVYDVMCNSRGFRRATKALNITAFWVGLVGAVFILVSAFFVFPKIANIAFSAVGLIGGVLAFSALLHYGTKNRTFRDDTGIGKDANSENIYFAAFYLVAVGTVITTIFSCISIGYDIVKNE